ncbi:MAG: peptidoglycan-associated lipoprotein Pal [Proteobacteria bacterium]|nr:peptidoglycan-associated lipoprotein Pal [Pseudomonadota bacterium]
MFIRLLLVISLTGLLFACTNKVKEEEPAVVEDHSTDISNKNVTDESGAQAYGTDDSSTSGFSQLDDPQSPLSVRVIYFEYNSSEIRSEYRSTIEAHSAYLSQNPDTTVTLEGHADERGSREYNLALGERRALGVKRQMVILGTSSSQIRLVSYGEERPEIDGHDEASWQQNRRVEILY